MSLSFFIPFFCIYQSLPKGYQQIEDVTVMNSSDFDRHLEDNEFVENGSDFDGFLNDDNNDENLTRLPVKEIENVLVSSGVDKSEILHVFKMEGFKSPVKICVDNHSEFIKSKVGGKVFRQGLWVSARDVVIEVKKYIDPLCVVLTFYLMFTNKNAKCRLYCKDIIH